MSERIVLDPAEVSLGNRTELDITPWIRQEGVDWGEAEIEAFFADKDRGSVPVDFRVPNRPINIPFRFSQTLGGTTTVTARANIAAKVALFQKEGGWVKRLTASGGTVYADVVDGAFSATSVTGWESAKSADVDAEANLTCLPDFYEDERTLSDHAETSATEIIFTETSVAGDYPARVRIVVDDDQGQDQRGLVCAFRSRHYSSASTAALKYEAEAGQALDTAAVAALSGASGGTVITHGTLSTNWTPVWGSNIGGTSYLTHTGTYRLCARVYSTSGTTVQARAVWDVGDLVNPAENDSWRLPGASNFYIHDFGEVRLDASPVGTHRWQGQIQAKGDAGGENFSVDKVWLEPVDEGMVKLSAPLDANVGLSAYTDRDEFNQTAGTLSGKVSAGGKTWTGGGDADDFVVETVGKTAQRTAVSDSGSTSENGRFGISGASAIAATAVQVDFKCSVGGIVAQGVVARYTNTSNYFLAYVVLNQSGSSWFGKLTVEKRVSGSTTTLVSLVNCPAAAQGSYSSIRLVVDTSGNWFVYTTDTVGTFSKLPVIQGQDSALATGGGLASGAAGFFDVQNSSTANTRNYNNFQMWVPSFDAVTFANRSTQLTTDGHYRLDSGGTAYGPISIPIGDLPRLPVAGLEGRTTEVFIKASRGDFDQIPDSGIDDISARVYYRPSWLHVPNT